MAVITNGSMTDLTALTALFHFRSTSNFTQHITSTISLMYKTRSPYHEQKTNKTLGSIRSKAGFISENNSYNSTSISSTVTLVTCNCKQKKSSYSFSIQYVRDFRFSNDDAFHFHSNAARKKRNKAIIALILLMCPVMGFVPLGGNGRRRRRQREECSRQVVGRRWRKCSTECV